jgi:hypothetical protein
MFKIKYEFVKKGKRKKHKKNKKLNYNKKTLGAFISFKIK